MPNKTKVFIVSEEEKGVVKVQQMSIQKGKKNE